MMLASIAALALFAKADQDSLDCPLREIGLRYAESLQPFRPREAFEQIADALNGAIEARNCSVKPAARASGARVMWAPLPQAGKAVYVDAERGSDKTGTGSEAAPFQTIPKALQAVRAFRSARALGAQEAASIVLRKGTFYLSEPVQVTAADSFVSIRAFPGESVSVSGSAPLKGIEWKKETPPKRDAFEMRKGVLADGFDAAPSGLYTQAEATALCAKMASCAAFAFATAPPGPSDKATAVFKTEAFWAPGKGQVFVKNFGYQDGVAQNLYSADLSKLNLAAVPVGIRVGGARGIRARYPNARTVEQVDAMQVVADWWQKQPMSTNAKTQFQPPYPLRNDTAQDFFQTFRLGIGGDCAFRFTPAASYWCANNSQGGGPGPYEAPVGMTVSAAPESLPNVASYKTAKGAIVHSWRAGRWFSWAFEVTGMTFDAQSNKAHFNFSLQRGGNQGSRGGNAGQEFFIENVLGELDSPGEFFYDQDSGTLFLWYNSSVAGPPPVDGSVMATQTSVLFNVTGSQKEPVTNLSFYGITFRDAAPMYMDPHGTPAGGDWGVVRAGAVFFQGTTNARVEGCVFDSIDGNALFISGFARGTVVTKNEFVNIGETAISQWGYTDGSPVPGMGFDATAGNQPRGTQVTLNLVHEVGQWTKQNSFYFQSSSFGNLIEGNIAYNGPRAGINFDDGMGGGSRVQRNVLFNFCRESSDHGPFNSWDRVPYVFDGDDGKPTVFKKNDTIAYNWILANYHSSMAIDNDDGSAFYDTHDNVFIAAPSGAAYGGNSLKSDFGGHSNFHHNNLDLFWTQGFGICPQVDGYADGYYDNYLYLMQDGDYGRGQACKGQPGETIVSGNTVWSPTGKVTECKMSLKDYQKQGGDPGTTAAPHPEDSVVLSLARKILGMSQK